MKSFFLQTLFFFTLLISQKNIGQITNYNVGDIVDDFTVTDVNGNVWNLYEITAEGKFVYLDFFFDTCLPCQLTQHVFNEFYDKYGCNEGDIFMISINNGSDTNAEVIAYENEYGGPYNHSPAVGIEGNCEVVDTNFGVIGYPSFVLINPDNVYLGRLEGTVQDVTVEAFEDSFPVDFNPEPMQCNLNINEYNNSINFTIAPNPNHGNSINLKLNNEVSYANISIYNMLGFKVFSSEFNQSNFTINTNLSSSLYIIEVKTNLGMQKKKLLVK